MANLIDRRGHNLVTMGAPHFFKVVIFPIDQGIKIPTMFMRKYGDNFENVVWLKVPTGAAWPVELLHTDNGTWLHKGWQEFAEYYAIEKFHFLVFRYDGNSQFHVVIFDKSASEIEYPIESTHLGVGNGEDMPKRRSRVRKRVEIYSDDDESIEILEEISAPCKAQKWSGNAPRVDNDKGYLHGLQFRQRIKGEETREERNDRTEASPVQFSKARDRTALSKGTSIAYQRAKAFKSEYPFFIVFMQPTYVSASFMLNVPLTFARNYLTKNSYYDLELRLFEGKKTWPMRCHFNSINGKIYHGWKEFVLENRLVVGDACVFELVTGTNIFNVIIYRRS